MEYEEMNLGYSLVGERSTILAELYADSFIGGETCCQTKSLLLTFDARETSEMK